MFHDFHRFALSIHVTVLCESVTTVVAQAARVHDARCQTDSASYLQKIILPLRQPSWSERSIVWGAILRCQCRFSEAQCTPSVCLWDPVFSLNNHQMYW